MRSIHDKLTPLLLLSLFACSLATASEPRNTRMGNTNKPGVGQNISFVEKLVYESAAAKQITNSGNEDARILREKAIAHLNEAIEAEKRGDSEAISEALNKAKTAIFQGIRLVGNKLVQNKKQTDYNKKRQGLISLLDAHRRIRNEKEHIDHEIINIEKHVESEMREADNYYDKEELVKAREVLDNAYLSLKLSLTRLRDGQTLRRTLNFATKEEEYMYELRRNDTHNMLINTVLKEKREDPRLGKLMDIPLLEAQKLRGTAERQAGDGDHAAAIKTLEESTRNIIRAIRMAGIFIPG